MSAELTEAEREALKVALYGDRAKTLTLEGGPVCKAVESIVTARLAAVEAERDAAQEHIAYHLRDFRPAADMVATGDLAVDMVAHADRLKVRAEAAEQQLADLRASITALADEWESRAPKLIDGPEVPLWAVPIRDAHLAVRDLLDGSTDALAAVRAQAKAEALRELADDIDSTDYGWTSVIDAERFKQRLRARADQHAPTTGEPS